MSIFEGMGFCDPLNLKDFVCPQNDLTFSYNLKSLNVPAGQIIVIQQQETGFSLNIQLQQANGDWIVRGFTIHEANDLKDQSLSLYDAAMVEIVLQAIDLLFFVADQYDLNEITFYLSKDEADHLFAFNCFFDNLPAQGAERVLRMPATQSAYDVFVKKTEVLKAKVRCELWSRQREDALLKKYLQSPQKMDVLSRASAPIEPVIVTNNVLAFNPRAKSITAGKTV